MGWVRSKRVERGGEVDSKERRGRVQRWLADATFYNREEGPTKDLLAGERERRIYAKIRINSGRWFYSR